MKLKTGGYNIAPGAIRTLINKEASGSREALDELNKLILYNWMEERSDIAAAVWPG
jgi:hypothetical protein